MRENCDSKWIGSFGRSPVTHTWDYPRLSLAALSLQKHRLAQGCECARRLSLPLLLVQ